MMAGNLIQALHIALLIVFFYCMGRVPWVGALGFLIIVASQKICCGYCPLTALSNMFLKNVGGKEHPDLLHWLAGFLGFYGAVIFCLFMVLVPFATGLSVMLRRK